MSDLTFDPVPSTRSPAATTASWSALTRLGFRFAFCYFLTYALGCGNATI